MVFDKPIIQNDLFEGIMGIHEYIKYQANLPLDVRKGIVLISITEPDSSDYPDTLLSLGNPVYTSGYHDVLEMKFWDVEETIGTYTPLSDPQGKELREFIIRNLGKKYLVHCRAGMSRSAGIGKAIECLVNYGGDTYTYSTGHSDIGNYPRYFPNNTVYAKILKG